MTFEAIVAGLRCLKPTCECHRPHDGSATVHCPAHDDEKPSLSVTTRNGKILVHCQVGCSQHSVIAALRERGLWPQQKGPRHRIVAIYPYRDPGGEMLYEVVRSEPKAFRQRRPDGHGGWIWNLDGVQRVLYRLPELLASGPDVLVFVVEGEKDVNRLLGFGLVATTNPGGAGKWRPEYGEALRGRNMVILSDNDDPGRDHAKQVATSLQGIAASVKILELHSLPPKGDVSDWIDAGGTGEKLLALAAQAPVWALPEAAIHSADYREGFLAERILRFRTGAEIAATTPSEVVWIAKPWVAKGAITEVDGKVKAAGKTTWVTHLVRAVLDGTPFMGEPTTRTRAVYLTEQSPATFRVAIERADLLGSDDIAVLYWRQTVGMRWDQVVEQAVAECHRLGADLLIVDTIGQFTGLGGDAENESGAALEAMRPLHLAAGSGLAIVIVRHERKSGGDVGDSGRGSSAWAGAVDIVLSIRRPQGASRPTVREIHAISRLDGPPDKVVIEITPTGYTMLGTAADVARQEARAAILQALHDPEHEISTTELFKRLEGAAISRTTAQTALADLEAEHQIVQRGEGKRGDPYRYRRLEIVSAGNPSLKAAERKGAQANGETSRPARTALANSDLGRGNDSGRVGDTEP